MATDEQGDIDMDAKTGDNETKIDEGLYNRQLYVIDHESMQKITQNNVLIIGMNGLGAEIAKNIILAGVKSVSILDKTQTTIRDLASHFYLTEADIGKERASACVEQLQQLNRYVKVSVVESELSNEIIESGLYQVVVMVGYPLSQQIEYNNLCRKNGIKFISSEACGVFGSVFVDLGDNFEIRDTDGEPRRQGIVQLLTIDNGRCSVTVHEGNAHQLSDGDMVTFEEVEGTIELNNCDPIPIIWKGPHAFELDCDASTFTKYTGNGMFYQVKQPKTISFQSLESLIQNPPIDKLLETVQSDFKQFSVQQHIFYRALNEFRTKNQRFPIPTSTAEAISIVESAVSMADTLNASETEERKHIKLDKQRLASLARCTSSVINPMAATLGGIVGQEVLKACSGKFTPINQLFYIDAYESLPSLPTLFPLEPVSNNNNNNSDNNNNNSNSEEKKQEEIPESKINIETEFAYENSRYDDNIAVYGKSIQNAMLNAKVFLVGAGAIGCEMLKNWALMGVGCSKPESTNGNNNNGGNIIVTDMDSIEKSNLNRQFLFRDSNVGQMKSDTAAQSVKLMNPDINIISQQNRVGSESEDIYNDEFWMGLNVICTALDNVDARLYVDAQCVKYNKPMLESGTLGTKGNTQVIVPKVTESYGSSRDPPEKTYPICTLHNFPNRIEHVIAWAKDQFDGSFTKLAQDCNDYLNQSDYLEELAKDTTAELDTLKSLSAALRDEKPLNFKDCIQWTRNKFEHDYNYKINQLLHNFPRDSTTNDGQPFWTGPKRAPNPIIFDENDPLHIGYVSAGAILRAAIYDIKNVTNDFDKIRELLKEVTVKEYKVRKTKIAANDEELEALKNEFKVDDYDEQVQRLRDALPKPESLVGYKLNSFEFDKDLDPHLDFMVAAANLRARNYRVKEGSRHDIKGISGKIIPAIATTTALVTGLISFEFYKLMSQNNEIKRLEDYKNVYVNLALPLITMSDPIESPKGIIMKKGQEWNFSLWDKIEIVNNKDMTCQELMNYFETEWGMELNMLSFGTTILYAFYMTPKKQKTRKEAKLRKLAKAANNNSLPRGCKFVEFEVSVSYLEPNTNGNDDDEDPEVPTVRLYL